MSDHAHPAAASTGDVLVVEDLVVTTRGRAPAPILDGISLRVGAGETVCLVGESGSGKSVTSLATMGLLPKGRSPPARAAFSSRARMC